MAIQGTTSACRDAGGSAAESADADRGDDDSACACLLERVEWRCCARRYVAAARDDCGPLALIETWRKA